MSEQDVIYVHPDSVEQVYANGMLLHYRITGVRPEPVVKAEALRDAAGDVAGWLGPVHSGEAAKVAGRLRYRADELDPHRGVDEPTGLGAVVEAGSSMLVHGVRRRFIRDGRGRWLHQEAEFSADDLDVSWQQLRDPVVLSPGYAQPYDLDWARNILAGHADDGKIAQIKRLRLAAHDGRSLGLAEAKDLVERFRD